MTTPEEIAKNAPLNLYQRIAAVMKDVDYIQKEDHKVNGQYRPVSWARVIATCRPVMLKYGVLLVPSKRCHMRVREIETKNGRGYRNELVVSFVCINIDNPTEQFEFLVPATAYDSLDKDAGKAMSFAKKYAYLNVFAIETGDGEESKFQTDAPDENKVAAAQPIDNSASEELKRLCKEAGVAEEVVASAYGASTIATIPVARFGEARSRLMTRIEKMRSANGQATA